MSLANRYNKTLLLLFGLTTIAVMFALSVKGNANFDVTAILRECGVMNPPQWLVWAILAAGSVTYIATILASAGLASIPASMLKVLNGADGAFA